MTPDGLETEGATPSASGEHMEVGAHSLVAEPGSLPANSLVWRCEFCDETSTGTGYYRRTDCEGVEDS